MNSDLNDIAASVSDREDIDWKSLTESTDESRDAGQSEDR